MHVILHLSGRACILGCLNSVQDRLYRRKQANNISVNKTSSGEAAHVPFALYYGSVSHYLEHFRLGRPASHWPYSRRVLELYQQVWMELKRLGHAPNWWRERILT